MKWRLSEGSGECIYYLGVKDNGKAVGVSIEDLNVSIKALQCICEIANADIRSISRYKNLNESFVSRVSIQSLKKELKDDLKVMFVGKLNVGKTTLISALKSFNKKEKDDGKGFLRSQIMKHRHEILAGHTSSTCFHFCSQQERTMLLVDTPGSDTGIPHPSAISTLTHGSSPDVLVLVKENDDYEETKTWHTISTLLNALLVVVFSKSDLNNSQTESFDFRISCVNLTQINKLFNFLANYEEQSERIGGLFIENSFVSKNLEQVLFVRNTSKVPIVKNSNVSVSLFKFSSEIIEIQRDEKCMDSVLPNQFVAIRLLPEASFALKGFILSFNGNHSVSDSFFITEIMLDQPFFLLDCTLFISGHRMRIKHVSGKKICLDKAACCHKDSFWFLCGKNRSIITFGKVVNN